MKSKISVNATSCNGVRFKEIPSQSILHQWFDYDPETGVLTKKHRPEKSNNWNSKNAGKVAGSLGPQGYLTVEVDTIEYRVHRLIYAFVHGYISPFAEVDHKNGNRSDNRIENLQTSNEQKNQKNMSIYTNNTSGFGGVCWAKNVQKWRAYCRKDGKQVHLGCFVLKEDAFAAVSKFRAENGFSERHCLPNSDAGNKTKKSPSSKDILTKAARAGINAFKLSHGVGPRSQQRHLTDLMVGLLHLTDKDRLDWGAAMQDATNQYIDQTDGKS